ncbi:hypothetical protein RJD24_04630 [Bacillaceae bacterium IKA-2]|nr:hypothetical protein RJD24_04630 [Bacillaceae bacterium IKA-2]
MKKVFVAILFIITIYSIYYDLTIGTLPKNAVATTSLVNTEVEEIDLIPSESIVVEPGYTVLSVVEELNFGPINASIQQIIYDFEILNPNTDASNIQIGKAYLFPIY